MAALGAALPPGGGAAASARPRGLGAALAAPGARAPAAGRAGRPAPAAPAPLARGAKTGAAPGRAAPGRAALSAAAWAAGAAQAAGAGALVAGRQRRRRCSRAGGRVPARAAKLEVGEKAVGIDLGTSTSLIAVVEAGVPAVVPNAEGERVTPSVVAYAGEDGAELLVGRAAKRQAALNPENTFYSVKRFMGRRHCEVKEEAELLSYSVEDRGDKEVRIHSPALGRKLAPAEVSAQVLRKLKEDAAQYLDAKIEKAVVTVPAYFDEAQRQATRRAAEMAGLEVLRIANEPTMAALAYGINERKNISCLVIDLGGGTLDVSFVELGNDVMEVMSFGGDGQLGGDYFDARIVEWIAKEFKEKEGIDLLADRQTLQRLTEAAERAKNELSTLQEARVSIPFVAADERGVKHVDEVLTREMFDELTADLVKRIYDPVYEALDSGTWDYKQMHRVDEVVLIGGASRIPAVVDYVKELTRRETVHQAINADEAVALGAALQASMMVGEAREIMLIDVTPLTLGVETDGGVFTPVINRNTRIPVQKSMVFTTSDDCQDEIEVVVCQGERTFAADNKMLGKFRLYNLPPAPRGIPQIEVTFKIDRDGVLTVRARDMVTRQVCQIKLDSIIDIDDDEVERALKATDDHWESDMLRKERLELQYTAECLVQQTKTKLLYLGPKVPQDIKPIVEESLDSVVLALGRPKDHASYWPVLKEKVSQHRMMLMRLAQRTWGKVMAPDHRPGPGKPMPAGGTAYGGWYKASEPAKPSTDPQERYRQAVGFAAQKAAAEGGWNAFYEDVGSNIDADDQSPSKRDRNVSA